ncbi:MAG TPA: non-homologous end-joining DNA ligase [bacterium]|nr:non-homologous end-joining DNA ligase [bacterium]
MTLDTYRRKRRFDQTPEPSGEPARGRPANAPAAAPGLRFVVQEHHATRLHWDLRLEMAGALRSWAVPKGPSLDPAEKRLAVLVEDHPIEYGEFEGVIPPGNYGAGTVLLWDRGTYTCREGDPTAAFERGKLTLDFEGERLRGEFHFVRTKRNNGRDWLLFKGRDEYVEPGFVPVGRRSVASGRTIEEIADDRGSRWTSGPPEERRRTPPSAPAPSRPAATPRARESSGSKSAKAAGSPKPSGGKRGRAATRSRGTDPFPRPFKPMLAESGRVPFDRVGWSFEVKWDGVRALAFVRREGAAQEIVLYGRSLRRLNSQFPEIVDALAGLDVDSAVLDGEIFAPDDDGRPSFHRLQQRLHLNAAAGERPAIGDVHVAYTAFDCLYLEGHDLRSRPFVERRAALDSLALSGAGLVKTDAIPERGTALFEAARAHGFEGIVAKKLSSPYRAGARSADWVKVKIRRTLDAVVGGVTRGRGGRSTSFGALVLGQCDETGGLVHIGQTGGGFSDADLEQFRRRLAPLETTTSPFAKRPNIPGPVTWVRPEIVVEVEYGEWTPDGLLRFPIFMRVRDDVAPQDVRLERPKREDAPPAAAIPKPPGDGAISAPGAPVAGRAGAPGREEAAGPAPLPASRRRAPAAVRSARSIDAATLPPDIAFSNLDKVFFPERGYTKGNVIEFYRRIAPYIVPHLEDRPLTLRRWPNGIHGEDFFQKDTPEAPPFVRTLPVWSDQGGNDNQLIIGADEKVLLWLAQMGCIEMHPWFSRITPIPRRGANRPATVFGGSEAVIEASTLNYPDFVVFDIDPFLFPKGEKPVVRHGEKDPDYSRQGFAAARRATLWVREALDQLGLRAFVKTSGKTGLHVVVPLKRRYTYAQTHAFARTFAEWLTAQHPDELTTAWAVEQRVDKVFLDYNQNARGKTMASVYSLRPIPEATVSVPVKWEELEAGFDPLEWTIETVFDRLARTGDLWAGVLDAAQELNLRGAGTPAGPQQARAEGR